MTAERAVAAAAVCGGLLIAQQVAGRALRDALFLSAFSVESLPGMMVASALVSVCGALAFAAALARRPPAIVLSSALGLQVLLLLAEWRLAGDQPRLVAAALYAQLALLGPGIVSAFWSFVNERFDPHAARRVMGRIGTGASLGGVAGGALAWAATHALAPASVLLGLSAANLLAIVAARGLRAPRETRPEPAPADGARSGWDSIRQFPYLRQLASVVMLGALAEALLDYLLKAGAAARFADGAELARFFSLFYASVALATLLLQALVTRSSLERAGLAGTAAVQPVAVALASAVGLMLPSLAAAVAARGLGGALRDSLFRSGYELFYTPLPPWQKRRSKALVDVAADKLGTLTGAFVVMALAAAPLATTERGLWLLALLAMAASLVLVSRLRRGYVRALEGSLRSGLVAMQPEEALDSTTRLTLNGAGLDRESLLAEIQRLRGEPAEPAAAPRDDPFLRDAADLRSGDAERIRGALVRLEAPDPALAPLLVALLQRDDVLPDVLNVLRRLAPQVAGQLIDALLDPRRPARVRRRVPRVLKACATPRVVEGLLLGLDDVEFAVRRACGSVLASLRERHAGLALPAAPVYAAAARELERQAAQPDAQLDLVFALLSSVGEREPLRVSRLAFRSADQRLRGTALEYLEQVLPESVRQPLLRRLGTPAAVAAPGAPRSLGEVEDELRRSLAAMPRETIARLRRS